MHKRHGIKLAHFPLVKGQCFWQTNAGPTSVEEKAAVPGFTQELGELAPWVWDHNFQSYLGILHLEETLLSTLTTLL